MDPNHNTFSILGHLNPNKTSNPNTIPFLDQLNTNTSTSNPIIKPTHVLSTKQSAFVHYNASSSASKKPKKYSFNHFPKFATKAAISRHFFLRNTVQGGTLVQFYEHSDLFKLFQIAKLEPLVMYMYKVVCHGLVKEFYCNLKDHYGLNEERFFTSVLDGIPMLVTHEVISKALGFHFKVSKQPIMDVTQAFIFDKNEFQLYISTFYKCDIPNGMFNSDEALSYVHFAPEFQILALIFRANIFPKPNHDKLFNFMDLKIMFMFLTGRLDFNISYMILLNMISATQMSYMPYGMLLSCVFSYLKLDVSCYPSQKVCACISGNTVRNQVPLSEYVPMSESGLNVNKCMADHALLVGKVEEFQEGIGVEIEGIRNLQMRAMNKINNFMNVVFNLEHKVELLEQHSENMLAFLKKKNLFDDMVVPDMGNKCESVNGQNMNENEGMEEGEIAAKQ